jgi:hypothetical protein
MQAMRQWCMNKLYSRLAQQALSSAAHADMMPMGMAIAPNNTKATTSSYYQ